MAYNPRNPAWVDRDRFVLSAGHGSALPFSLLFGPASISRPLLADCSEAFSTPRSPCQRGSNENTNGLLRQYFPKGLDIADYSQAQLNAVARQLNNRPRKTLDYETPAERFNQTVALTS